MTPDEANRFRQQPSLFAIPNCLSTNCSQRCPYCSHPDLVEVKLVTGKHDELRSCSKCRRRYVLITEVKASTQALKVEGEEGRE